MSSVLADVDPRDAAAETTRRPSDRGKLGRLGGLAAVAGIAVLVALVVTPVGFLVYGSFQTDGPGAPHSEATMSNWDYALGPWGLRYLSGSVQVGLMTAVSAMVLGGLIAWLVARTDMPGRAWLGRMMIVPLLFSPLMTALAWIGLADPNSGLLNDLFAAAFGTSKGPFDIYSLPGVVLVLALHFTPYVYTAVRPALLAVNMDMEDASRILGARERTTLGRITFPLVIPALLGSGFLVFVLAAENFSVAAVLGSSSGVLTIPYGVYASLGAFPPSAGRGSALGLLLTLVSLVGMSLYLLILRRQGRYVTVSGKGVRSGRAHLSSWAGGIATGLVSLYLVLAVALPYFTLILGSFSRYFTANLNPEVFTLDNYTNLFTGGAFLRAIGNTGVLVVLSSTFAVLLSSITAWIGLRGRGLSRRLVDYAITLPVLVPGVAMGLGMLWAYTTIPTGLYGTLGILFIAYLTRYLGQGQRVTTGSMVQFSSELEEAAFTLGASKLRAFVSITMRLVAPALAAAWILIAVFAALEVPASVMLYTARSMPVSVFIYLQMQSGIIGAFAPATLVATLVFAGIFLAQRYLKVFDHL
jgi:iron(III) transport system permease protein